MVLGYGFNAGFAGTAPSPVLPSRQRPEGRHKLRGKALFRGVAWQDGVVRARGSKYAKQCKVMSNVAQGVADTRMRLRLAPPSPSHSGPKGKPKDPAPGLALQAVRPVWLAAFPSHSWWFSRCLGQHSGERRALRPCVFAVAHRR